MDNFGYIYTFWDKKQERYVYVGQTGDFKSRMKKHLYESKKEYPHSTIEIEIMEYGINNYDISKMEFPLSDLNNQEMYFIRYFQTREYYGGCNLTDGGDGIRGYKFSEDSKRKMSEIKKGKLLSEEHKKKLKEARKSRIFTNETKRKISESNKGKHFSEETKEKISNAKKGKSVSEETKRKISNSIRGENHPMFGKHHSEETKDKLSKPKLGQSLGDLNPELTKQWHPTKNGNLTPFDVCPNSNKKAWWICEKGHEWLVRICKRNRGNNCPYCSSRKVCIDNCLATKNSELSKQWHPIKNGDLTPFNVCPNSMKKVWWVCKFGHEWLGVINNRNNGAKCPHCANENKKGENNINSKLYKITSPNNETFTFNGGLRIFCRENNLSYGMIQKLLYMEYKKDNYKGWKIEYYNGGTKCGS